MIRKLLPVLLVTACIAETETVSSRAVAAQALPSEQVNLLRRAAGLGAVRESPRAIAAARRHAVDLARTGGTGHAGSDGSTHDQRLHAVGCRTGVENVAWDMGSTERVFAAWMGSPGHRQNILWPEAQVYGLARAGERWVLVLATEC